MTLVGLRQVDFLEVKVQKFLFSFGLGFLLFSLLGCSLGLKVDLHLDKRQAVVFVVNRMHLLVLLIGFGELVLSLLSHAGSRIFSPISISEGMLDLRIPLRLCLIVSAESLGGHKTQQRCNGPDYESD